MLPKYLTRRFVSEEQDAVVVSGRIPDIDASELLPTINELDKALDTVRSAHPGYKVAVTGLAAIAARNSSEMISKLNAGLTIEIVFVAAFIGLAFRSFFVLLLSILPGIFPIVVSGAVLWFMGEGLQFASVVALTISFGLGLSATIHYLNRLRLEYRHGEDPAQGVIRPTVLGRPGADPDIGGFGLRTGRHDLLGPAVAQAVRMAERFRDARRAGRRLVHPAGNGNDPAESLPLGAKVAK